MTQPYKDNIAKMLVWWLAISTQFIGVALGASYFGLIDFILATDITYLSFVIFAMWIIGSVQIGYIGFNQKENYDTPWFISESCLSVGMIGTLVGFIIMLGSSFANVDPGNIDSMKSLITSMAVGMSTALVTTLVGLVASLALKIQIVILEHSSEKT